MAGNKHAASRNPPKKGALPTKTRGAIPLGRRVSLAAVAQLALFRLNEGSNKQPERK
jgi:hypothetical protein